jgi:hypothetical protein
MPKKHRSTPEEVAAFYEKLGSGTPEERLSVTAKYYGRTVTGIQKQIRFWWPGAKYLKEFGNGQGNQRRWDMPTDQLLKALNEHRSMVKTAKALKTTPITLAKALTRKNINHVWVVRMG